MEWIAEHPEFFAILFVFIAGTIGGWILIEIRRLHSRIDKRDERWEEIWRDHQEESMELHKETTQNTTKLNMHLGNGHRHPEER